MLLQIMMEDQEDDSDDDGEGDRYDHHGDIVRCRVCFLWGNLNLLGFLSYALALHIADGLRAAHQTHALAGPRRTQAQQLGACVAS